MRIDRRAVIRAGAAAGLAAVLAGCGDLFGGDETDRGGMQAGADTSDDDAAARVGSVIIVGAGPAGMSAAAMLARAGVDVRVLEARPTYGGRIRHTRDFVDFPIPLGGEWLHEDPDELTDINGGDEPSTELAAYQPTDEVAFYDGVLTIDVMGSEPDSDLKFVGSTWLDFFETYLLPDIADRIEYDVEVVEIDYAGDLVVLTSATGEEYTADRAIVTVPIKLLQDERIEFTPPLPPDHRAAIERAEIWDGMKVFVEFSERFYPVYLSFPDSDTPKGQRLYYDASYGQKSDAHVLGLFTVGTPAEKYQAVDEGDELRDLILAELDDVFDGAASRTYLQHIAQNWNAEPFARAAYLADEADWRIPETLAVRFSDRLFLAGDAYTSHGDWSAVDDAARSARDVVRDLLA